MWEACETCSNCGTVWIIFLIILVIVVLIAFLCCETDIWDWVEERLNYWIDKLPRPKDDD